MSKNSFIWTSIGPLVAKPPMDHVARLVEHQLETLVAGVVGREQETPSSHE